MIKIFKDKLEDIVIEIEQLSENEIGDWINENILEIDKNCNELILTIGGPSIRLYVDSGIMIGQESISTEECLVRCDTSTIEDYLSQLQ